MSAYLEHPNAHGFAYFDANGVVMVESVSPTETAVKVNVIVVGSYGHVVPTATWDDDMMERAFLNVTEGKGSICPITISKAVRRVG